ncbi:MAG: GatB/YqeY domain-containing protein [Candidatus Saccharimonadales bacterium]
MQEELERDLKSALLGGDKALVDTLRTLKSALYYEAGSLGLKPEGMNQEQIRKVLSHEAKKRQEAADLYKKAGESERSDKELQEKAAISKYLPPQLSEAELGDLVNEEIGKVDQPTLKEMGGIIGAVRKRCEGQADGSLIARLVKEKLQ